MRLLTEEEARETECRAHPEIIEVLDDTTKVYRFGHCIASKCAMWEWASKDQIWEERGRQENSAWPEVGYCGLKRGTP